MTAEPCHGPGVSHRRTGPGFRRELAAVANGMAKLGMKEPLIGDWKEHYDRFEQAYPERYEERYGFTIDMLGSMNNKGRRPPCWEPAPHWGV